MEHKGIYIPSIDAKDLYLSAHYLEHPTDGYHLTRKDGQYNLRKFVSTLDYSLDLIELLNVYYKKYRRKDFAFKIGKHMYSANVINVTFQYSVKEWNQMNRNTFVKFGYDYRKLEFNDCIARNEKGEIVGIQTEDKVLSPITELPNYFCVEDAEIKDKKNSSEGKDKKDSSCSGQAFL